MRILFLVPYPLKESPSQRFRFEQYFDLLSQNGFQFRVQSFLDSRNWRIFYKPGKILNKVLALLVGFSKRVVAIAIARSYDFIFIHREAAPLGPPILEWILVKILRRKVIYDFDDAIWLKDRTNESAFLSFIKFRSKVGHICKWSYKVSCGNDFLCSYARTYNSNVIYNPTTIDTEYRHNPRLFKKRSDHDHRIVIGWTGSHSTLKYLDHVEKILHAIEAEFPNIQVLIIADIEPTLKLKSLTYIQWNEATEIEDLMNVNIGLMPLPDDDWAKGKCGFKALQYMALGIPAIASPVGVNVNIIDHGQNGFLCRTTDEWLVALKKLVEDKSLRERMGELGREKIINNYSVASNSSLFLKLFE